MFFILSKILSLLLKPTFWIFFLLISCLIFKNKRKKLILITLITFYIFTNGFIVDEFSRMWEIPRKSIESTYDVGIVLGGISDFDNITSSHNFNKHADRLMDAEQLYHKGLIQKIMISGGSGTIIEDEYIEANSIEKYLEENNIPSEDIIIENKSRNTKENIFNSSKILKEKYDKGQFLLITSASHMRRSLLCCKKASLNVTPFPTDCTKSYRNTGIGYMLLPRVQALDQWETLIKEWIGYLVYTIRY